MMNKKITTILCLLVAQHMFTMKAMELAPTPTNEVDISEMAPTSILPNEDVPSLDFLLPKDVEEFDCREDGEWFDPSDVPSAELSRKYLDVLPNIQKPQLKVLQGHGVNRMLWLSHPQTGPGRNTCPRV
nr:hypothetical protein [Tanacetum cinerariifolium]